MAKRHRRKRNSAAGDLAGFIAIGLILATYAAAKDFSDRNPNLVAIIIAAAVLLVMLAVILSVWRFVKDRQAHRAFTVADIDSMTGVDFEYYLAKLLKSRGFTGVKVTEKYDLGVDVIAKKDGVTWGVQAKRYKSPVKANAVRQVYTALNRYKCDRAMVVTNSTYTRPARELANDTSTVLVGRDQLKEWVLEYSKKK